MVEAGKPMETGLSILASHYPTWWVRRKLIKANAAVGSEPWIDALWRQGLIRATDAEVLGTSAEVGNLAGPCASCRRPAMPARVSVPGCLANDLSPGGRQHRGGRLIPGGCFLHTLGRADSEAGGMMVCRRESSKQSSPWARRGSLLAEVAMWCDADDRQADGQGARLGGRRT